MRMSMETEQPTRSTSTRCAAEAFGSAYPKVLDLSQQRCGSSMASPLQTKSSTQISTEMVRPMLFTLTVVSRTVSASVSRLAPALLLRNPGSAMDLRRLTRSSMQTRTGMEKLMQYTLIHFAAEAYG